MTFFRIRSPTGAATGPARPTLTGLLTAAATLAGAGACLATLLGFAGALWWPLDLLTHFRVQYLALAAAGALILAVVRRRRLAWTCAACVGINGALLAPYLFPAPPDSRTALAYAASVNVHTSNRSYEAVRRFLRKERLDIVLLLEVDDRWMEELRDLRRDYPYGVAEPRDDNFGIALLSRHPCHRCEVLRLGEEGLPSVKGEFAIAHPAVRRAPWGGSGPPPAPLRFTLVGTHPVPPVGAEYARLHAGQLRAVGDYLARVEGPKILMGDLNTSPGSPRFRALLRRGGLADSGVGRGVGRTWPVGDPLLGVQIDHFLSSGLVAVFREIGPDVGSDHFPLRVGFTH